MIQPEFPQFDYTDVYPTWPEKTGPYAFTEEAVRARGKACRAWLRNRPEKVIAVVSHSAFLRIGVTSHRFANADYRVYEFIGDDSDQWLESKETAERGGGMGQSRIGTFGTEPYDFEDDNDDGPPPRKPTAKA